jgi:hypothetical protein
LVIPVGIIEKKKKKEQAAAYPALHQQVVELDLTPMTARPLPAQDGS